MPFIAIIKAINKRIDITQVEHPKLQYSYGDCICQLCRAPLRIRGGPLVRNHFAHDADRPCDTEYSYQPESPEHREAKRFLLERLRKEFPEYRTATIDVEVPIIEIKRVADILVTFLTGWKQAHEIQLSSITADELEERTNDYERAGIDVVWWLGKGANVESNRRWCIQKFGCNFSLNFSD